MIKSIRTRIRCAYRCYIAGRHVLFHSRCAALYDAWFGLKLGTVCAAYKAFMPKGMRMLPDGTFVNREYE